MNESAFYCPKPSEMFQDSAYIRLDGLLPQTVFVKIEAFNLAGSVKIKTGLSLINRLEAQGALGKNNKIVESSSGNLGVALSMICASRGYPFTCVVDPNSSARNIKMMQAFGAKIVMITKPDQNSGYLGSRIQYIQELLARDPSYIWTNQYANPANVDAHMRWTAMSIDRRFPLLDYLFIGAGTTGTLMGCLRHFSMHRPEVKIIAVDSVGSVTFGGRPGKRHIPGLGTSRRPEIFEPAGIHGLEMVEESQAIAMCRHLAHTYGLLAGGSTGTVLAAVLAWQERVPQDAVIAAISPDLGERYLDTIYDDEWVQTRYGGMPQLEYPPATAA